MLAKVDEGKIENLLEDNSSQSLRFRDSAQTQTNSKILFNTLVRNTDDKIFKFIIVE
jgi:hypothetical protein